MSGRSRLLAPNQPGERVRGPDMSMNREKVRLLLRFSNRHSLGYLVRQLNSRRELTACS